MEDTWHYDNHNYANLIMVSIFLSIQFIWMLFVTASFCKVRKSDSSNGDHSICYNICVFPMAIAAVVMASIQFVGIHDKAISLQ